MEFSVIFSPKKIAIYFRKVKISKNGEKSWETTKTQRQQRRGSRYYAKRILSSHSSPLPSSVSTPKYSNLPQTLGTKRVTNLLYLLISWHRRCDTVVVIWPECRKGINFPSPRIDRSCRYIEHWGCPTTKWTQLFKALQKQMKLVGKHGLAGS